VPVTVVALLALPFLALTSTGHGGTAAAAVAPPANSVLAFGDATLGQQTIAGAAAPIVGMAATPDGGGYWLVASDGGIFSFGDARFHGSTGGLALNQPIVGMAATPDGGGYWLVASDGGIFSFGDARFYGSTGDLALNRPIVGMAATPDGGGYWLVASDGGIFSFGDARFYGSTGGQPLNAPIVGMAPAPAGGYWLVASDGGIFTFGAAQFYGSTGGRQLNAPIVGMAAGPEGSGYWLVASDGGVFPFGDVQFYGSEGGAALTAPAVAIAAAPGGGGYWIAIGSSPLGGALPSYVAGRGGLVTAAVLDLASGRTYVLNPGVQEAEASISKVDIMSTLFAQLGDAPVPAADQQQLVPMIEQSDNDAATTLFNADGGAPGVTAYNDEIGMDQTAENADWGLTTTTATDQLDLLRHLVQQPSVLTPPDQQYGLSLMEQVTPSQDWGVSAGVPAGVNVALKNGWLPLIGDGDWQVNSIGWISGDGRDYLIAVLTTGNPTEGYGIDTIEQISSVVYAAM
jgi:hypothetical protein